MCYDYFTVTSKHKVMSAAKEHSMKIYSVPYIILCLTHNHVPVPLASKGVTNENSHKKKTTLRQNEEPC